jgi:Effector-associated domain 11
MNKAKIQQLISQNRLDEAIKELLVITKNTHLYNDVLLNSTRFQQYRNLKIQGTESSDDLNRLRTQISHSLLALTENLEDKKVPTTFLKNGWLKIGVIVLIVALVGWAISNLITNKNTAISASKDKNTEQKDTLNIPQPVKQIAKESEKTQSTKSNIASEPQNTVNNSSKPIPTLPSIKYVDEGQSIKVAFFKSDASVLPDFQRSVEGLFKEKGISISNNYLQKAFYNKFGNNIKDIDISF